MFLRRIACVILALGAAIAQDGPVISDELLRSLKMIGWKDGELRRALGIDVDDYGVPIYDDRGVLEAWITMENARIDYFNHRIRAEWKTSMKKSGDNLEADLYDKFLESCDELEERAEKFLQTTRDLKEQAEEIRVKQK